MDFNLVLIKGMILVFYVYILHSFITAIKEDDK